MIKNILIALPVIIIHLLLLSILTFTAWPEMLSYPYLISSGFKIYSDVVIPYPPILPLILVGVFGIFGFDPQVLRWFSWLLIALVDLNLFILVKMMSKSRWVGLFLLGVFAILQSLLDGNMLWFDFATVVPLSFALIFFYKWSEKTKLSNLLLTVLFLALGTAIKQTAVIYFLPFIVGYLLVRKKLVVNELLWMAASFSFIWLPIIGYLILNQLVRDFWLWNFVYPLTEWSKFPGYVDLVLSRRQVITLSLLITPVIVIALKSKSLFKDSIFWLGLLLLGSALLAVYPRFSFFHLQPAIFCLIVVLGYMSRELKPKERVLIGGLIIVCILPIIRFQFQQMYGPLSIRFSGSSDKALTQQIKTLTTDNQKIYLLGPTSAQYVFSKTLPPKPWMDSFGWYMEIPTVQDQLIEGLQRDKPEIILWQQPLSGQWYQLGVYQPEQVVSFIRQSYVQLKVLDNGVGVWTRKN